MGEVSVCRRGLGVFALLLWGLCACAVAGCGRSSPGGGTVQQGPHEAAAAANRVFLEQKVYDPWVLTGRGGGDAVPRYTANGQYGYVESGGRVHVYQAGRYSGGALEDVGSAGGVTAASNGVQTLNMHDGVFVPPLSGAFRASRDWPALWQSADIGIVGDAQAQQVTHANMFYLLSSAAPGKAHSLAPMGLSSAVYGGHIFWDAEVWMLPALLPQHPDDARTIIDYRFERLAQARLNAKAHGFPGAEYPWESAATGAEVAPAEFARERHITADVAWAAWEYYLWTGDRDYLRAEGWPLLRDCATYWAARAARTPDGEYHINGVLSPDETAGLVDDDAWTNAVVADTLRAAARAASLVGATAPPQWTLIAAHMARPFDMARRIPLEHRAPLTSHFQAKQADTLLLLHPLHVAFDAPTQRRMLDFYAAHTSINGPAMTASIHAIVAARLGRAQQSLDAFHASYQPFERGPWDAFSEKRTTNNVYFLTGMGGCVQAVLYGFAGLQVAEAGQHARGTRLAGDNIAALYADPHLPPGWSGVTVKGVRFRGHVLDIAVTTGNKVAVTERK